MFSVVILTRNEERNIASCIQSLDWCDDIHIIDSGSSDHTVAIAKQQGAKIHINRFTSFANQRNWALEHCDLKYEWILHIDADERSTRNFHKAMLQAVKEANSNIAGFYCCRKLMLNNQWLRYSSRFPQWQFRISRRSRACFIDYGDAQKDSQFSDDQLGFIHEPFIHLSFSKGWLHWFDKQNKYAALKAQERLNTPVKKKHLISLNRQKRDHAFKVFLSRFSIWPGLRFFYTYFIRLGFLDGKLGLLYCLEKSHQEFMIQRIMSDGPPSKISQSVNMHKTKARTAGHALQKV
jgi:glycosyltransferase involved in cell wall biosynthesis